MCLAIFKCLFIFLINKASVMKTHKVQRAAAILTKYKISDLGSIPFSASFKK